MRLLNKDIHMQKKILFKGSDQLVLYFFLVLGDGSPKTDLDMVYIAVSSHGRPTVVHKSTNFTPKTYIYYSINAYALNQTF